LQSLVGAGTRSIDVRTVSVGRIIRELDWNVTRIHLVITCLLSCGDNWSMLAGIDLAVVGCTICTKALNLHYSYDFVFNWCS
jgi:hypothetical protein